MSTAETTADDLEMRRRRALYRAQHRGTKEMDWMIGRYAAAKLPGMDNAALTHFEKLIQISDVELNNWLIKPEMIIDREFAGVITDIRMFHELAPR